MSMEAPPRNVVESPLLTMSRTTPTRLWNDSADPGELTAAISWGAVGATANPVIALAALRADAPRWRERLTTLAAEHPTATESELGWLAVEELSVAAAALLEPAFHASGGRDGRLSIQTDPRLWRDADRLVEQALHFDALAPNVVVKIPATSAGVAAIEEVTARGISINATVSFTVAQALAVGRGRRAWPAPARGGRSRRERHGSGVHDHGRTPRRLGEGGRRQGGRHARPRGTTSGPGWPPSSGPTGLTRARLPGAPALGRVPQPHALEPAGRRRRRHLAAVRLAAPAQRQRDRRRAPDRRARARRRAGRAVRAGREFRRAYDPDGLTVAEFDTFGATRRTLRQFLAAAADLDGLVRDVLLPDPDKERTAP